MKKYFKEGGGTEVTNLIQEGKTTYTNSQVQAIKIAKETRSYHYPIQVVKDGKIIENGYGIPK